MANKRITTNNFIFTIPSEKLKKFTNWIDDLTKIDDKIMLNINDDKILLYSIVGKENVIAFKSHILNLKEYFIFKEKPDEIKFIISDAKKFFKTLNHFKEFDEDVKVKLSYNEDGYGEKILAKNSKLKLETLGGLPASFSQNISIEQINKNMDVDKSNFYFRLSKVDFEKVKKLGSIDNSNEYYSLIVKDNKVIMGEKGWTLEVDQIESENEHVAFLKKYFNTIKTENEEFNVYVFPNFILVLDGDTNLMISTELTV